MKKIFMGGLVGGGTGLGIGAAVGAGAGELYDVHKRTNTATS